MDVSGRISATSAGSGRIVLALRLAGRITATSGASARLTPPLPLAGRITATSAATLHCTRFAILYGRTKATVSARAVIVQAHVGDPVYLSGRITATSSASITTDYPVVRLAGRVTATLRSRGDIARAELSGRIEARIFTIAASRRDVPLFGTTTTAVRLRLSVAPFLALSGRIGATVRARLRGWPVISLAALIKIGVKAVQVGYPFRLLSGRISARTSGRISGVFIPFVYLAGRISATTSARFAGEYPVWVGGQIKATAAARLDTPLLSTFLFGGNVVGFRGPSLSTRMFAAFQPTFDLLTSRITIQFKVRLSYSELEPPRPPIPTWFPTYATGYYLDRITSEHNQRPRYMRTVEMAVEPFVDEAYLTATLPGLFDLDYSVGQQEDFTGEWIGKSRWIELPVGFFSWDTPTLGWDEANWRGGFDAANALQRLDDYHYRLLLYAAIIANHWDGSVPHAYEAWDTLFTYTGLRVIIQDYGNMTMLYGMLWKEKPSTVLMALFTTGQMDLRPEGIDLIAYVFAPKPDTPLFAWDAISDSVAGWDVGSWGILVPPGVGYVPI